MDSRAYSMENKSNPNTPLMSENSLWVPSCFNCFFFNYLFKKLRSSSHLQSIIYSYLFHLNIIRLRVSLFYESPSIKCCNLRKNLVPVYIDRVDMCAWCYLWVMIFWPFEMLLSITYQILLAFSGSWISCFMHIDFTPTHTTKALSASL